MQARLWRLKVWRFDLELGHQQLVVVELHVVLGYVGVLQFQSVVQYSFVALRFSHRRMDETDVTAHYLTNQRLTFQEIAAPRSLEYLCPQRLELANRRIVDFWCDVNSQVRRRCDVSVIVVLILTPCLKSAKNVILNLTTCGGKFVMCLLHFN